MFDGKQHILHETPSKEKKERKAKGTSSMFKIIKKKKVLNLYFMWQHNSFVKIRKDVVIKH